MKQLRKRLAPAGWENQLTPDAVAFLRGENDAYPWVAGISLDAAAELYRSHAAEMIAEHIAENPGSRPRLWWQHCAPEPRRRLGGIGSSNAHFGFGTPEFGIPAARDWMWPDNPNFADVMDRPWREMPWMKGVEPVDPSDSPRYESQAAFLKRHQLFVRGEAARLTPADFADEVVRRAP
jgi:hypothetical protein